MVCLAMTGTLWAQIDGGTIAGTVTDASGAVVPGASVEAVEPSTGTRYQATSTSAGAYRIPDAKPGRYDVTITGPGFKRSQSKGVLVQIGTVSSLDVKLALGDVSENVTVDANAPALETETSEIGTVVDSKQVLDLPLSAGNGIREPQDFIFLAPGTVGPGTAGGGGGSSISKISGGQNYGSSVLLDGLDSFNDENGSNIAGTLPSVEALNEFKILTSTPPAEYGRTTGGITNFSVASGSNRYHGKVYEIFRNTALDANNWFSNGYAAMNPSNAAAYARPNDKKNNYGLVVSGPLSIPHVYDGRDKTFFLFSWEQYKQTLGTTITSTIPTVAERNGDFSALIDRNTIVSANNPCNGQPVYAGEIFDPSTTRTVGNVQCRDPFSNNRIDPARFSTVAKNVLALLPQPQNNGLINNYAYTSTDPILQTVWTVRIDQNIGTKHKIFGDYTGHEDTGRNTTAFAPPIGANADAYGGPARFVRLGWNYIITPRLLNHLVLGYNRTLNHDQALAATLGKDWPATLGIGNVHAPEFPQLSWGEGMPSLGYSLSVAQADNGLRAFDNVEITKGKHSLQAGVDWRYQEWSPVGDEGQAGYFNWGRAETAGVSTATNASGNGLASFLLGQTDNANLADHGGIQSQFRQPYTAFFFQDNYKALPNLVLNLGMRWDFDTPRHEHRGNMAELDPTKPNPGAGGLPGALIFGGVGPGRDGNVHENFAGTYMKDIAPRVGFSWTPSWNSKVVLRGGYGILYGQLLYSDHGNNLEDGFVTYPGSSSPDGFNPAFSIDNGFPAYTHAPFIDPSASNYRGAYGGVSYIAPGNNRPAMVQNWSLQTQTELAPDLIFTLGYVGQHSTRLRSEFDQMNDITLAQFSLGTLLNAPVSSVQAQNAGIKAPFTGFNPGFNVAQAIRPFPQYYNINTDCCAENYGQSSYHALEATLERRFRNGINLLAAYTWSKTITDADSALPAFQSFNGGGLSQNAFDKKTEKSISNQDIPQTLVVSYIYELSVGRGKKFLNKGGVVNAAVGGWQLGGILRYQSGQPYAFCCGTGVPGYAGSIRFNRVAGQPLESAAKRSGHYNVFTDRIFNAGAFQDPNSADRLNAGGGYLFGNMPRVTGEVRTQVYANEDMSLIKRTQVTERATINFHADFFNVFNRHVFNRVGELTPFGSTFTAGSNSFGLIQSTIDSPRNIQLQMKVEF